MKISQANIICDMCHARTPTIKDDVFLDEQKKTNQYENKQTNKKKKRKRVTETRLLQVSNFILKFVSLETIL